MRNECYRKWENLKDLSEVERERMNEGVYA